MESIKTPLTSSVVTGHIAHQLRTRYRDEIPIPRYQALQPVAQGTYPTPSRPRHRRVKRHLLAVRIDYMQPVGYGSWVAWVERRNGPGY